MTRPAPGACLAAFGGSASMAIGYRLVTFYLPPLWGWLAMRWLRKRAYV